MGRRTLRSRLTFSYAVALGLALLAFAVVALFAVDFVQRNLIDGELLAVAREEAATVDYSADSLTISASGAARFDSVAGSRVASALLAEDGRSLVASVAQIPGTIPAAAGNVATTTTTTLHDHGIDLRVVFVPITADGDRTATTAAWTDIDPIERVDKKLAIAFTLAIPFLVGLATLAGTSIARRGLAPLNDIVRDASEIEAQNLSARVSLPDTAELHLLATTLNRMLERLDEAFERERRFTSDASHEFRAPIAVILAEADLALAMDRPLGYYRRALETIAIEAENLEGLSRNLLASARSSGNESIKRDPVDLAEVAASAASRLSVLAARRGVTIKTHAPCETFVAGHADELEQAILTLLHNAIKFASPNGSVFVEVEAFFETIELRITDDGAGFSADALAHAFERFWREDGSQRPLGHGLGLPIARSIVERYGGTIMLANQPSGAIVTLTFKPVVPRVA
jgi:signal transduction histidine kinase